jgi:plastocyanin
MTAAAGVAAVVLAGCGSAPGAAAGGTSSPSQGTAVTVINIKYSGGQITPAPSKIQVAIGTRVQINVTSDVPEQVHNHYDGKEIEVPAGGTAVFAFTATQPGVYEVELHHANKVLTQLQVG